MPGDEHVRFTDYSEVKIGEAIGAEIGLGERARQMIAQTIRQHLRKEDEFAFHGRKIKVLSLFFVDSVAKYRVYDENGEAQPGEYARIFEEEYAKIASEPEFNKLLGSRPAEAVAAEAHQGYFSVDRGRGGVERLVDTKETTDKGRQQASLAYEQIMKNKVGLTTPGTPIRFIFSHSALQEGWDNRTSSRSASSGTWALNVGGDRASGAACASASTATATVLGVSMLTDSPSSPTSHTRSSPSNYSESWQKTLVSSSAS